MPDLLIEIGCEEIPARMIDAAREELAKRLTDLLERERLTVQRAEAGIRSFSTPRRLAVLARHVSSQQPNVEEQLVGPATKVAFKDGSPTPAAEAFARKAGVDIGKLERITNSKGEYLAATVLRKGRGAGDILVEALPKELNALYWAKNMYWRTGKPERFVRPVRWMVALLDAEVVPLEFGGVRAGNVSEGHRILGPEEGRIDSPAQYTDALRAAHVIGSPAEPCSL